MEQIDEIDLEMKKVQRIYEQSKKTLDALKDEKNRLIASLTKEDYTLDNIYTSSKDTSKMRSKTYYKILYVGVDILTVKIFVISDSCLEYDTFNYTYDEFYSLKLRELSDEEREELKENWKKKSDELSSLIDHF